MNVVSLTGRITNDLELKLTQSGVTVCSFTLAVKRPKVSGTTDFIDCVAFRHNCDYLTNYAQKGTMIEVSGALTTRKWEDKNGNKRTSYEVIVDSTTIIDSKKADKNVDIEKTPEEDLRSVEVDGDLPF